MFKKLKRRKRNGIYTAGSFGFYSYYSLTILFLLVVFKIGSTVEQGYQAEEKSRRERDEKGS